MPAEKASTIQAWLCLRFTHLGLNSLRFGFDSCTPFAITYQQKIWQCNSAALESKITEGMSINHALMLDPKLQLQERDPQAEEKKLQELSYWAYRYTSLVSQYGDNILLLEVGKSSKLFNSLKHLIHLIKNDLVGFKIEANLGLAQTPKASIVISALNHQELNSSYTALAQANLQHLEQDSKTIQKLLHCGFQTLADIQAIPRVELGSRFGQEFLVYLTQLWGDLADPQIGITPPETFHASANFAEPIHNVTWIQQQLDRLLDDLVHFITSRQLLCRSFTWHFYHENNRLIKVVSIGVSASQNLHSTFKELTNLKLENIKFDWEFSSITLSSDHLLPIRLFNDDLFNPTPDQEQFQQLIDKLTNRLGQPAVFHVQEEKEYLPELANACLPTNKQQIREAPSSYQIKSNCQVSEVQANEPFKDQPLWLLEKPTRLMKHDRLPLFEGPLSIIHGPNRITSHWWETLQSRDYFIVRQRNGRLLWVFFDRVNQNWFLHGLYA